MNHEDVPMMFRAQVSPRSNLQRIESDKSEQDIEVWARQWKKSLPQRAYISDVKKPKVKVKSKFQSQLTDLLSQFQEPESTQSLAEENKQKLPSDFGQGVETKIYTLNWRLTNNSGADPSINRPAFGAQGYPFYTGSSMKGAFRRACTPEQKQRYCGGKSENEMKPSEVGLRFHGGYPADETWREKIVDLVHPQEQKQVTGIHKKKFKGKTQIIQSDRSNAMAQMTFAECKMKFGISSFKKNVDWTEVWSIWEKALENGLGGRTSAGYGYFKKHMPTETLLTVSLLGQGVASKMLDKEKEFRPNMFKAALRGHTLRLLTGLTNEITAQRLTKKLWGGFGNKKLGLLAVVFETTELEFPASNINEPIYKVSGNLKILLTDLKNVSSTERNNLRLIATKIIQFTMLFGGFGKSWRRVDHSKFKPDYPKKKTGHQIGCYWEYGDESSDLYLQLNKDENLKVSIVKFIDDLRKDLKEWGNIRDNDQPELNYREAWHKDKVEVWGRVSKGEPARASKAVHWLHDTKVKKKLGGSTRHTGRIWHRMYPYTFVIDDKITVDSKKFIEVLVLFLDHKYKKESYDDFLLKEMNKESSLFEKIW